MKISKYMKSMVLSGILTSSLFVGLQAKDSTSSKSGSKLLSEKSRTFVGAQVGMSLLQNTFEYTYLSSFLGGRIADTYTWNYTTTTYGILGGYEHWFSDSFGARGYALFNGSSFYVMQFGVGADAIWNFTNVANGNMGLFGGLQASTVYWLSSWYSWNTSDQSPFGFDIALNIGLRWSQKEHAIELLGKFPFIKTKTGDSNYGFDYGYGFGYNYKGEYYSKENFSLVARYIYRF